VTASCEFVAVRALPFDEFERRSKRQGAWLRAELARHRVGKAREILGEIGGGRKVHEKTRACAREMKREQGKESERGT